MAYIGEVLTSADFKEIKRMSESNFSQKGFIAPTVFRLAGGTKGFNYYTTLQQAVLKNKFLQGYSSGVNIKPAGAIQFSSTGAETMGINVDFFLHDIAKQTTTPVDYKFVKANFRKFLFLFRFIKTDGSGPHYCILDTKNMGISATATDKLSPKKLAALDEMHRQLQIAKSKYNTLAVYLQEQSKKNLNPTEQRIFNQGLLTLNNYERDLRAIKGVDIVFGTNGIVSGIGIVPIVLIVIIIASAALAAYSIEKINEVIVKTKALNAAYDLQKFSSNQILEIDKAEKAGLITPEQAERERQNQLAAAAAAQKNITDVTKPTDGIFDKVENILLFGGLIFLASKFIK